MPSPYELKTRWLEWHERILVLDPESGQPYDLREFLMRVPIELLREVLEERERLDPHAPQRVEQT
jgi:hypothetical protein